ncbi:MAG: cupin domain-containing protein [Acidimicrobiaceae bacterium]|nr:cupin domain-containing protein [Acidimicrobiaceae bacterium]
MASTYDQNIVPAQELLDTAREAARAATPERQRTFVRELSGRYSEIYKRIFEAPRVIHAGDVKWGGGPQMFGKSPIDPDSVDTTQLFHCHFEMLSPGGKSQKHGHMNSAAFYILDGEGYDVHDGVTYPWRAGDVCIVEPGCVHQHFNADPEHPAKMLIMKAKPLYLFANLGFQGFVERAPKDPVPGFEGWLPDEVIEQGGLAEHGYSGG